MAINAELVIRMKRIILFLIPFMFSACQGERTATDAVNPTVKIDVAQLTDSSYIERRIESTRMINNDTLTEREIASYVYVDYSKITLGGIKKNTIRLTLPTKFIVNRNKSNKYVEYRITPPGGAIIDTMLLELSETQYVMSGDTLVETAHLGTILRHFDWTAKCYFKEYDYNGQLYRLYQRIMSGDSISDEDLLQVMPENHDQYLVYSPEGFPNNMRSNPIDRMVLQRAKTQPLFVDAYINQFPWSDGAGAEVLYEDYFMRFFQYDSVYFNEAIRRILPEFFLGAFDDEWYEYARKY